MNCFGNVETHLTVVDIERTGHFDIFNAVAADVRMHESGCFRFAAAIMR